MKKDAPLTVFRFQFHEICLFFKLLFSVFQSVSKTLCYFEKSYLLNVFQWKKIKK